MPSRIFLSVRGEFLADTDLASASSCTEQRRSTANVQASFGFPLAYSTSGRCPCRACGKHRPVQPRTAARSGSRDRTYLIQLCQYRIQSGGMGSTRVLGDPHAMTAPSIADLVRFGHEQLAPASPDLLRSAPTQVHHRPDAR